MSTIDSIYSSLGLTVTGTTTSSSTSESTDSASSLSFTDYMSLFLTELENQDPTEPLSTSDMVAQTYYFSQLELSEETNGYLESLLESQQSSSQMSATQLIGHSVLAEGDTINVADGESTSINFELDGAAENVEISVYDNNNNLVDTITLEDLASGDHEISWDATNTDGETVSDGDYHFTVSAQDSSGSDVDATTYSNVTIASVSLSSGDVYLDTQGGDQLELGEIVKVI